MHVRVWGFGARTNRLGGKGCQQGDMDLRSSDMGLGQLSLTPVVPHFLCVRSSEKLRSQAALA